MRLRLHSCLFALVVLLGGCTRGPSSEDWHVGSFIYCLHGHVDFVAPPTFEISLGSYKSVMCFDRLTVLRMGGTYVTIELPYYVPACCVALLLLAVAVRKLRKRGAT